MTTAIYNPDVNKEERTQTFGCCKLFNLVRCVLLLSILIISVKCRSTCRLCTSWPGMHLCFDVMLTWIYGVKVVLTAEYSLNIDIYSIPTGCDSICAVLHLLCTISFCHFFFTVLISRCSLKITLPAELTNHLSTMLSVISKIIVVSITKWIVYLDQWSLY